MSVCETCRKRHRKLTSKGARRCQKHSKRHHGQCGANALAGYEHCRNHGGRVREGVSSPHFKHGRYAKLPPDWAAKARTLLADPELLSLLPNIAITDARIDAALDAFSNGKGPTAWARAVELVERIDAAATADERARLLGPLLDTIRGGKPLVAALMDLDHLTEQRRRLVESEVKRQSSEQQSISYDRALALLQLMMDVVMRVVVDQAMRAEILTGWTRAANSRRALPPAMEVQVDA